MTEPLKPRIDFTGTLEKEHQEAFKTAQTFNGAQADNFAPVLTEEPSVEDGPARSVDHATIDQVSRPTRSPPRRVGFSPSDSGSDRRRLASTTRRHPPAGAGTRCTISGSSSRLTGRWCASGSAGRSRARTWCATRPAKATASTARNYSRRVGHHSRGSAPRGPDA